MRQEEEKTFEGQRFWMTQLDGMRGVRAAARVGRLVLPAIGRLAGKGLGADVSDVLGPALDGLFERLTADELEGLVRELLATTAVEVNSRRVDLMPVFAEVMRGRFATVLQLVRWSVDMNGFFDAVRPLLGSLAAAKTNAAPESESAES